MIDGRELAEMGLAVAPVALMVLGGAILTRVVLVDRSASLLALAVAAIALSTALSLYLGWVRVSREYGDVLDKYS